MHQLYLVTNQKHNLAIGTIFTKQSHALHAMRYALPGETLFMYTTILDEPIAIAVDGTLCVESGDVRLVRTWNFVMEVSR